MNREDFFARFANWPHAHVQRIQMAYWLSKEVHRTTPDRDSGERYFEHPRRVAASLADRGVTDSEVIVLALLHDAIEDTPAPLMVYERLFSSETVTRLLTLSKKIPRFESFSGMVASYHIKKTRRYFDDIASADLCVRQVKVADRLDNVTSCDTWSEDRRARYAEETMRFIIPISMTLNDRGFYHSLHSAVAKLKA